MYIWKFPHGLLSRQNWFEILNLFIGNSTNLCVQFDDFRQSSYLPLHRPISGKNSLEGSLENSFISNIFCNKKKVGVAGGGVEICTTIFISEVADNEYVAIFSILAHLRSYITIVVLFTVLEGSYQCYIHFLEAVAFCSPLYLDRTLITS